VALNVNLALKQIKKEDLPDQEMLAFLVAKRVEGEARIYLDSLPKQAKGSVAEILAALALEFDSEQARARLRKEMESIQQAASESACSYFDRKATAMKQVVGVLTEETRLLEMKSGLREESRKAVVLCKSMIELRNALKDLDASRAGER
jgi:hypothetical protein